MFTIVLVLLVIPLGLDLYMPVPEDGSRSGMTEI